MPEPQRLRRFIDSVTRLVDSQRDEAAIVAGVKNATAELVAKDDWLPEAMAKPHAEFFQQYLLYCDPRERFSVVSFVWGPGQGTPVHDHTVWGLIGMLRGAEYSQPYREHDGRMAAAGPPVRLEPGDVGAVSPTVGDVHRVHNAFDDRVSISIHVYGADIGAVKRHTYPAGGGRKPFVSGYANTQPPDLRRT